HLCRAQSVVSEIVSHLERQGMLERESDPADRRRTLIWLTPAGHAALHRQREVLSADLLTDALSRMHPDQADALLGALRALVQSAPPPRRPPPRSQRSTSGAHRPPVKAAACRSKPGDTAATAPTRPANSSPLRSGSSE